ncbi:MAG: terminase small subunit, partial [Sphingomonas taxi]
VDKRSGYPVYRLADVAGPILGVSDGEAEAGVIDPRDLAPKDRKDYFQSENERLKVEMTMGTLVPAVEVEADMADLVKQIVQFLDTLPDDLERKLALKPEQVVKVQERCDRIRQLMYEKVVTDEADGDARDSA